MRGKRLGGDLALLAGMSVLCILVLEAALRLIDGVPLWPIENLLEKRNALLKVHVLNDYHPVIGWVLKENNSFGGVTTGERGVRMNNEEIQPVPRGGVLAVGDSFTAGSEVANRESWPAHLERLVQIPVINAAAGGWGADQIVLRAEELLPVLRPRAVVVDFLVDDIGRAEYAIYGGGPKPYFTIENGELVHHNRPVPQYRVQQTDLGWSRALLGYFHIVMKTMEISGNKDWFLDSRLTYKKIATRPAEVSCRLLARFKQAADAAGIPLVFVLQYGGHHVESWKEPSEEAQAVLACARGAGIETVDTWETLRRLHETDLQAFRRLFVLHDNRLYGHMSSAGNRLIAELVGRAQGIAAAVGDVPVAPPTAAAESRNMLPFGSRWHDPRWVVGANASIAPASTPAPDGSAAATALRETPVSGEHYVTGRAIDVGSGSRTFSVWLRPAGRQRVRIQLLDLANRGAVNEVDLVSLENTVTPVGMSGKPGGGAEAGPNGWVRAWVSARLPIPQAYVRIQVVVEGGGAFAGTPDSGIDIWGGQLEDGTAPTDYTEYSGNLGRNLLWDRWQEPRG